MDDQIRRAELKIGVYLFLGALAVRLIYLCQYANAPFFWVPSLDALFHDLHAQAIVANRSDSHAFFRAPLYYYFLAGVYKLFGHSFWTARILQALIGSGSCVLLYSLGRRLFRPAVALLAGVMMALYGPLVFFDGELLTPVLEVFLDLCFLLLLFRAVETGSVWRWLAAGVVLGLSAITRPNVLVVAPLVLGWMGWRPGWASPGLACPGLKPRSVRDETHLRGLGSPGGREPEAIGSRGSLGRVVAVGGLFLAGVTLAPGWVTLRNYRVSGDAVFIASQGGINLFLGNRPEADGFTPSTPRRYRFAGPYEDSVALYGQRAAEEAAGRPLSASETQAYWVEQVVQWWRRDPISALKLTGKKGVLAWTHRELRNNHAYDFVRAEFAPFLRFCPFGFWFAGPLGLLGMVLAWRSRPEARFLALFVLVYVASYVPFFVADRYRLPAVPPLLLFGAFACAWIGERVRTREWRRLVPAAAGLAALVLFVNGDWYRTETPAAWALDYWSAGNGYQQMGRLREAEALHRKALALDPRNAEIWTNLGVDQYYGGRLREASASFRTSIDLAPRVSSAYFDLAMCELQLHRPDEARRHLQQAVRVDPEHASARAELARLEKAVGSGQWSVPTKAAEHPRL
jgi:tetratricopeptide (TPR) repeat protein